MDRNAARSNKPFHLNQIIDLKSKVINKMVSLRLKNF